MDFSKYHFTFDRHRDRPIIKVRFKFDKDLQKTLRLRFPSAKWSKTKKTWYLPDLPSVRTELQLVPKSAIASKLSKIHEANQQAYVAMHEQLKLKRYSQNTIKQYLSEFHHLLNLFKGFSR